MFIEGVSKEEGESACFSIVEDENLMGPVDAPAVLDDLELGDEESVEIKGWRGKLNNSKSSFYITPLWIHQWWRYPSPPQKNLILFLINSACQPFAYVFEIITYYECQTIKEMAWM